MTSTSASSSRVFSAFRRHLVREVITLLLFASLLLHSATALAPPTWWGAQNVLTPNITPDDFAMANVGQLKTLANKAALQMHSVLPGGEGNDIQNLVQSWLSGNTSSPREDFAAVTVGEVKTVAKLFYDRLGLSYPWAGNIQPKDDFAAANIGQLKTVFAFDITGTGGSGTGGSGTGGSGTGNINIGGPDDDYDHDGISNSAELALGTDPKSWDTDGDGISDSQEMTEGTDPKIAASSSAVLIALTFRSPVE